MAEYPSCGGGLNLPRVFERQITWSPTRQGAVVSRRSEYEVEVYEQGERSRVIRRDLPVREATSELAITELGEGFRINFGTGPCTIPPQEMVEKRGHAETVPWISDLISSPSGELWVARKEVGSDAEGATDVFDWTGACVGTLRPETPFPLLFLDESRFGAVETDEFDVSRLVIYSLDRK